MTEKSFFAESTEGALTEGLKKSKNQTYYQKHKKHYQKGGKYYKYIPKRDRVSEVKMKIVKGQFLLSFD
jgi:hypothetical protein